MQRRYQWNKNFANGDRYNGEAVADNVKDGHGEYFWAATGAVYKGSWSRDLPHGEGVMSVPAKGEAVGSARGSFASSSVLASDVGYTYEGRFECGQRSGQGTCRFTSGRVYVGEWKHDEMSGQGTLSGAPGGLDNFVEYRGPFLRGHRHGPNGCCRYANGDVYTGDWMQGKRHGQGRWELRHSVGSASASPLVGPSTSSSSSSLPAPPPLPVTAVVEYTGAFVQDVPACSSDGEVRYADGSTYRGGVSGLDVKREGNGELRMANGAVYTGGFHDNVREGKGTLRVQQDGSSYEGTWRDDQLDGHVVFRRPITNGDAAAATASSSAAWPLTVVAYVGPCQRNEFTGPGARVTFSDQSVYTGDVRNALPAGKGVLENRRMSAQDGLPRMWWWCCPVAGARDAGNGEWGVVLSRYEGGFFAGRPEGDGTGSIRFVSSTSSSTTDVPFPVKWQSAAAAEGGDDNGDVPQGAKGLRVNYRRNGVFTGKWALGVPRGHGCWAWDDGDVCEGDFLEEGLASGYGSYRSAQATYEGSFKDGQPHGAGLFHHLLTKERYNGEWDKGLFHGEGEYHRYDREYRLGGGGAGGQQQQQQPSVVYTGSWERGVMSGTGRETRVTAAPSLKADPVFAEAPTEYEGAFHNGLYHGYGRMRVFDVDRHGKDAGAVSAVAYEGEFTNGARTGTGTLTLADGTTVEGPFEDGQPHGQGVVATFPGKLTYRGEYNRGLPCGTSGEILYPNGDTFKGEVESAAAPPTSRGASSSPSSPASWLPQRHGKGVFKFVEGNVLTCTWRHNVLHGEGVYKTYTGEVSARQYVDGVVETRIHHAAADSIFTTENELPNTLSKDTLGKALAEGKKPFAFVRKGERSFVNTTGAGPAPGKTAPATTTTTTAATSPHKGRPQARHNGGGGGASPPAVNPSSGGGSGGGGGGGGRVRKTAESPPLAAGGAATSFSIRNGRRFSGGVGAARNATAAAAATAAVASDNADGDNNNNNNNNNRNNGSAQRHLHTDSSHAQNRRASASGLTSPRASSQVRTKEEVRAAIVKRMSSRPSLASNSSNNNNNNSSSSRGRLSPMAEEVPVVAKRPSLVEVFQEGINKIDRTLSTTTESASSGAAAAETTVYTTERVSPPVFPRGSLKGHLRSLMNEACAIRSSKEDEIHLLTEELRELNAKIWQLRFTMSDDHKRRASADVRSKDAERLAAMMSERKGTVEKLDYLLQS